MERRPTWMKTILMLSLLPRRPGEFLDRISAVIASRRGACFPAGPAYNAVGVEAGMRELSGPLNSALDTHLRDVALAKIERDVRDKQSRLPANAPFASSNNGDPSFARMCYLVARSLCPSTVVETGVCYGVTSAFLLQALKVNGSGHLHSVDLPPLRKDAELYVGRFVPAELRGLWTLHRGSSRRILPPLLSKLGPIDIFVHDSLHTYRNMQNEFALAWASLRPGAILISDDVAGNAAFLELAARPDVARSVVINEQAKDSLFGVVVKGP